MNTPSEFSEIEHRYQKLVGYFKRNRIVLTATFLIVGVSVAGYLGYEHWYRLPLQKDAQLSLYKAENKFYNREWFEAINGDAVNDGFLQIIENYDGTPAANLSRYYIGIAYLNIGEFQKAIAQFSKFKTDDPILKIVYKGCIADAYVGLEDYPNALTYYNQAINIDQSNQYNAIYLKKMGLLYEKLKDYSKALDAYKKIKQNYVKNEEYKDIDAYIKRVEAHLV